MPRDYGYFGKGSTGYAHYMTAFRRSSGGGGGGGNGGNPGCGGCLAVLIGALLLVLAVAEAVAR